MFDNSFISSDQTLYGLVVVCKPLKLIQRTVHVMVQHSATNVKVTGLTGGTEYKVQVVGLVKDRNSMASVSMYGSTTATIATSKGGKELLSILSRHFVKYLAINATQETHFSQASPVCSSVF